MEKVERMDVRRVWRNLLVVVEFKIRGPSSTVAVASAREEISGRSFEIRRATMYPMSSTRPQRSKVQSVILSC